MIDGPGPPTRALREVRPAEAQAIGDVLAKAAQAVNDVAQELYRCRSALDNTWEGNSKDRFFATFESQPGRLEGLAARLDEHARQIRNISVTFWDTVSGGRPTPF
jgi:WXG100 family type VII secretion target